MVSLDGRATWVNPTTGVKEGIPSASVSLWRSERVPVDTTTTPQSYTLPAGSPDFGPYTADNEGFWDTGIDDVPVSNYKESYENPNGSLSWKSLLLRDLNPPTPSATTCMPSGFPQNPTSTSTPGWPFCDDSTSGFAYQAPSGVKHVWTIAGGYGLVDLSPAETHIWTISPTGPTALRLAIIPGTTTTAGGTRYRYILSCNGSPTDVDLELAASYNRNLWLLGTPHATSVVGGTYAVGLIMIPALNSNLTDNSYAVADLGAGAGSVGLYYNSSTHKLRINDGSAWRDSAAFT